MSWHVHSMLYASVRFFDLKSWNSELALVFWHHWRLEQPTCETDPKFGNIPTKCGTRAANRKDDTTAAVAASQALHQLLVGCLNSETKISGAGSQVLGFLRVLLRICPADEIDWMSLLPSRNFLLTHWAHEMFSKSMIDCWGAFWFWA